MWYDTDKDVVDCVEPWTNVKSPALIDSPPLSMPNPREQHWASGYKRLWIQTDNQLVANAFAGDAAVTTPYLQPVCVRIGRKLQTLLRTGWKPRLDTVALIEWDPRHFNAVADHAANAALDYGTDWDKLETGDVTLTASRCWRLSVDGAYRGDGSAAAGVAIYSYDEPSTMTLIARFGRILNDVSSSLVAELIAVELGLDLFANVLKESVS